MAYAALALIAIAALLYQQRQHNKATATREKAWDLERAGLLTRIQHPEIVVGEAQPVLIPDDQLRDAEDDEIDLVGTVQVGNGED